MHCYIYALSYKEEIMSLPHALLGLISYQPSTGYELRTTFSESVQFFWNATLPQIYRTLNQMESQGWLTVKVEPQEGRPSRKIYSITDAGMKELTDWLITKPEMAPERNPLLIKVFFGRLANGEALRKIITGCREYHEKLLLQYATETASVIQQYAEACSSHADAAYWTLTLDFGQRYSKMVVEWCDHALTSIGQTDESSHTKKKRAAKP
jgi:DNA-binding PadR family transcriptional regulator